MIIRAARRSARNLLAPETREAFWKTIGLTVLLMIGLWFAIRAGFEALALPWFDAMLPAMPDWTGWVGFAAGILASIGLALGLAFLVAPATAIVAGLFIDDVAAAIERRDYPGEPEGRPVPLGRSIVLSIKFFGVVLLGNLLALSMLLLPGINLIAFFVVNGYLLGREYFEFAAMRHRPEREAKDLRARHFGTVFLAGLLIAGFVTIPLVNLLTPLFATGLMVHLHKAVSARPSLADQHR